MTSDDLFNLLDMGASPSPAKPGEEPLTITADSTSPPVPASQTALVLDRWSLRRGHDFLMGNDRARVALDPSRDGSDNAAADMLAAAYEPDPKLVPRCVDETRHAYLTQLMDTAEYRALHQQTTLDEVAAELAATAYAEGYCQLVQQQEKQDAKSAKRKGLGAPKRKATPDPMAAEMARLKAAAGALARAESDISDYRDACGLGLGSGSGTGAMDAKRSAALFRKVRSSETLRRIAELAGRFRRVAQSKQRAKTDHGMDDLVGVTLGGDVGKLIPSELADLAADDEALELDLLRRLAENQAMVRDFRGIEPQGKGPVIVCVDESGSMGGNKIETAKALALALVWVARKQRRWVGLVAYSGDSGERVLSLPPTAGDERNPELLDWLEKFIGQGSTLDVPLRELPRYYAEDMKAPPGKTDVVLITDAIVDLPDDLRDGFLAWKALAKARVQSLIVDGDPGDLAQVSDEVYRVASIDAGGDEVGKILAI